MRLCCDSRREQHDGLATMGATPREVEGSKCLLPDSPVGGSGSRRVYSLYEHFGSMIVYRNELSRRFSIEWLVNLQANLLSGSTGRFVNGIGAICLTSLCMTGAIIWWPGIKNWRRSLTVNWRAHFARISGTCIARSDCGVLSLYWCGEFQGSISLCTCRPGIHRRFYLLPPRDVQKTIQPK